MGARESSGIGSSSVGEFVVRIRAWAVLLVVLLVSGCGGGATVGTPPAAQNSPVAMSSGGPGAGASAAPTASATPSGSPAPVAAEQLLVSGPSPFAGTACGTASGTPAFNSVAEPQIASDPHNGKNIVLVWQQDRFNADGGAVSNVVGVSHDGGNSFHEVLVSDLSLCTGGTDQRSSDPWLSWGPDGTLYLASLTFSEMPQNSLVAGPTELEVQRSTDAGETWSPGVYVQPADEIYNDREAVVADPTRPGRAYFTFVLRYGSMGESGIEEFASTANDGATWTTPVPIYVPPPAMLTDPTLLLVNPDGSLLNLFIVANLTPFLPAAVPRIDWEIMSQRSTNAGQTWTDPVTIATIYPAAPVDPQSGKVVRAYPLISAALAPGGTAYVAWNVIPSGGGSSTIDIAHSTNGGVSWSSPTLVKQSPAQAFLPSLAIAKDGTIAVTYDDTRNDSGTGSDDNFTTDVWLSLSHDGGNTWAESHFAGPFNMATAPESDSAGVSGLFVGDYQGLTALSSGGFGADYAQGEPQAVHGPTDLFFSRFSGT
jgi:hypothetical protein